MSTCRNFKWKTPDSLSTWMKRALEGMVLVNAPRQSAGYYIETAWSIRYVINQYPHGMCPVLGYHNPGITNFACRITKSRKIPNGEGGVDNIAILEGYMLRVPGLGDTMGDDFARGHK
ncbi:hypothetical protein BD309DRAFT_1001438 [Dichomitus squalens]|uniref:Uncharacterized protein n=1 Tax=Dichomitus squalens TaxID=114155 RepID=A0A4Q9NU23_9APHY|nr:hypothetical protein BD309DRAFT_1001438 [Dichomitus squalens]TBU53632.1 hypothetical protein BD310DRAFT_961933 [Dichomitus squalens]